MLRHSSAHSAALSLLTLGGLIVAVSIGGCPPPNINGGDSNNGHDSNEVDSNTPDSNTPDIGNPSACTGATVLAPTDITTATTIPAGCYLVNNSIRVRGGGVLTISPGVTLQFGSNLGLFVESDGALSAVATAGEPIVLTAQTQARGAWVGLRFSATPNPLNEVSYLTVEYAGASSGSDAAGLVVTGPAHVTISHSRFIDCSTLGFAFRETLSGAPEIGFTNNTVTRNATGAGQVQPEQVGFLDATTQFAGNDVDYLLVATGDTTVDQVWAALGVPYRVQGSLRATSHMQVAAGTTLEFAPGAGLFVQSVGALTAIGTASAPIQFTCKNKSAGAWVGVRFASNTVDNHLQYATVEYGGYNSGGLAAGVLVDYNSSATVENCLIQHSSSYGIEQRHTGTLTQINNTFVGNAAGDVQLDP